MSTTCGWGYSLIQVFESLIIQYVIPVAGCATCPLLWVGPMQVFDDNMIILLYLL